MIRPLVTAALGAAIVTASSAALGAGLYFSDRGVRPLGRAGAFTAGADDGGAVYYNPAGLAFAGHQFLLDASWLQYQATYQRQVLLRQTDPNTGQPTGQEFVQTFESVDGTSPVLPIPTITYANPLGLDEWNFALSLWAPYAAITSYPRIVDGQPAPQRYSLITLNGSALSILGAYAAYRPAKEIALGAGIEMLTGFFSTEVAFSACVPDRFICAPEQPDYDSYTKLRVGPIFAPSGVIGATVVPSDDIRLGASFRLPTHISSPATVQVRLPSAPVFESARQVGDEGHVEFDLPWVFRVGVEARASEATRVEVDFVYEAWSVHDEISLENRNIELRDVQAFPPVYRIGNVTLQRGFEDAWSARLGGEHTFPVEQYRLGIRAGAYYEKGAIPDEFVSAATVDVDKVAVTLGGSLYLGKWRFDGVVARVFGVPVDVDPRAAAIEPVNPIAANPPPVQTTINGGRYEASANVLGVGLAYQFDAEPKKPPPQKRRRPPKRPRRPSRSRQ